MISERPIGLRNPKNPRRSEPSDTRHICSALQANGAGVVIIPIPEMAP